MPLLLHGIPFYTMGEVAVQVGVARQTLWRWAQQGRIPSGQRYRHQERLYTLAEIEQIARLAAAVRRPSPPVRTPPLDQLDLFGSRSRT